MGDALIVECLYSHKADANILDNQERTALHIAAEKGRFRAKDSTAFKNQNELVFVSWNKLKIHNK